MRKENIINIFDKISLVSFYLLAVSVAFSNSFSEIATAGIILSWIITRITRRNYKFSYGIIGWMLLLFIAWNILSFINTGYLQESVRGLIKTIKHILLFMACVDYFKTEKRVNKILLFCLGAGFIIGLNGIAQYIIGVDLIRGRRIDELDYLHRISSSFTHSNDFGAYLIVLLSIACGLFFSKARPFKQRILLFITGSVLFYCLLFTKSRGAWIGFFLSLLVLAIIKSRRLLMLLLILAVLSPFVMPDFVKERFRDFTTVNQSTGTVWERLELWNGAIAMIKARPFFGFGINTYTKNFPDYKPKDYANVIYTHNSYLQIASEIGLVGSGILIIFLISILIMSLRVLSYCSKGDFRDLYIGLIAGMAGFLFHCGVDTHLFSVTLSAFMFLCLGFLYSMRNIAYEKKS